MGRIIFLSKSRHQFQGLYKGSLLVYITRGWGGGGEGGSKYLSRMLLRGAIFFQ